MKPYHRGVLVVLVGLLLCVLVLIHLARRPGPVAPPALPMTPAPIQEPAPEPAPPSLPAFVPRLAWALHGPEHLRSRRLETVKRYWHIEGDLDCPTPSPHDCVVRG